MSFKESIFVFCCFAAIFAAILLSDKAEASGYIGHCYQIKNSGNEFEKSIVFQITGSKPGLNSAGKSSLKYTFKILKHDDALNKRDRDLLAFLEMAAKTQSISFHEESMQTMMKEVSCK